MSPFNVKKFVRELCNLGERQGSVERQAMRAVTRELKLLGAPFVEKGFPVTVPVERRARLVADGVSLPCRASSLTSGAITNADAMVSSLISSLQNRYQPNINFNPRCRGVSRGNRYVAPSLAVRTADVPALLGARSVRGMVRVEKKGYRSSNVLVGNRRDPEFIVFTHVDSIGPGACDNAAGVAACLAAVANNPRVLGRTLVVVSGNEELSYDEPVHWGYGYRVFERSNKRLLSRAKKILVVDSVGLGKTVLIKDRGLLKLGLPLKDEQLFKKAVAVTGDFDLLMAVYHSDLDTPARLDFRQIDRAARLILHGCQ